MPGSGTGVPVSAPTAVLYATVDEWKLYASDNPDGFTNAAGTSLDTVAEAILGAVSRQVEKDCSRLFYLVSAEARQYRVDLSGVVKITDAIAGADITIEVDVNDDDDVDTTLAASQYALAPLTEDDGRAALRYQTITNPMAAVLGAASSGYFVPGRLTRVTTDWGCLEDDTRPLSIHQATIILASRYWARREAKLGQVVIPEMGGTIAMLAKHDPDYKALISGYIHKRGARKLKVA